MTNSETKTCSITEWEIRILIHSHGEMLDANDYADRIERINYLNKRLNAKPKGEEVKEEAKAEEPKETPSW